MRDLKINQGALQLLPVGLDQEDFLRIVSIIGLLEQEHLSDRSTALVMLGYHLEEANACRWKSHSEENLWNSLGYAVLMKGCKGAEDCKHSNETWRPLDEIVSATIKDHKSLVLVEAKPPLRWMRISVHAILDVHEHICLIKLIEAHLWEELSLADSP
jgi:hypothetical protein